MIAIGRNARKSRPARPCAHAKRRFPRKRWPNWSIVSAPTHANSTTRLKNCACSPASGRKSSLSTLPPFARGTKRRGHLRWAMLWATVICRACSGGWVKKSESGLLYGLISKVRAMLLLKEMLREGWIKPEMDYNRFKAQLERVPADKLPADRRFNPLALNPYVLYKALPQTKKYTQDELVRAMDLLLRCNQRLVSSGLDEALVLQETLVQIVLPHAVAA